MDLNPHIIYSVDTDGMYSYCWRIPVWLCQLNSDPLFSHRLVYCSVGLPRRERFASFGLCIPQPQARALLVFVSVEQQQGAILLWIVFCNSLHHVPYGYQPHTVLFSVGCSKMTSSYPKGLQGSQHVPLGLPKMKVVIVHWDI